MRRALLLALLIASLPASAQVYRCAVTGGSVSYQEQPCDDASQGGAVAIPTRFPDYVAPRERLAAREAAADERILKRAQMESAERIARDERLARQAQLEAERERAAASAQTDFIPVFIAPRPRMDRRPHHRLHRVNPHSLPLMR